MFIEEGTTLSWILAGFEPKQMIQLLLVGLQVPSRGCNSCGRRYFSYLYSWPVNGYKAPFFRCQSCNIEHYAGRLVRWQQRLNAVLPWLPGTFAVEWWYRSRIIYLVVYLEVITPSVISARSQSRRCRRATFVTNATNATNAKYS
jgi:hypothetical protein